MNVMPNIKDAAAMTQARARVGLIIPSVNTYSEPQFNRFAPEGMGIHVARARGCAIAAASLLMVGITFMAFPPIVRSINRA